MNIVVIIPTYNEKVNMTKMIPVLENDVFPKIKGHKMHILVADDKSPDNTAEVVREFMNKWNNIELLIGNKEGLGAAYVRAMHYAMDTMKADAVVEFDADFQHDPHDIPRFIEAIDKGADYVIGSRYIPGGEIPKEWGLHRKFLSSVGSLFARIVWLRFDIHDMTSGYKLTKTEYLKKVDLDHLLSKYYAYKMHILHDLIRMPIKVKEVPIIFYERKEGTSKISRKDLFDSLYVVTMLRVRDSERFIKFLLVGGFGFILNWVVLNMLVKWGHWDPFFANLVGSALAIFSNYNFNNLWTFKERRVKSLTEYFVKLVQFFATSLIGVLFIQSGTIFLGDTIFGKQHYNLYFFVGTMLLLIWNFTVYNKIIWKK